MTFGELTKIIKIVATICQILRLKCTKIDLDWASTPDPAGGAYSISPRFPSWNKWDLVLMEGEGCREGGGEGEK